ncbi:MAG TPA: hypothetical protein PK598_12965, partial [Thermoanaerobaculia bacterium]|nr:hypothetical protein [Thermoanaerobaculia bacterium]
AVVAYVLASGLTRDSSAAVAVSVPAGTESVELSLPLEADAFPAYGVLLRTGAGAEVLERAGLRSRREGTGPAVVVEVPAEKLPPGDYVLTLSGVPARGKPEVLAQFAFRVPAR